MAKLSLLLLLCSLCLLSVSVGCRLCSLLVRFDVVKVVVVVVLFVLTCVISLIPALLLVLSSFLLLSCY